MSSEHPLWQEIQRPVGGVIGGQKGGVIGGQKGGVMGGQKGGLVGGQMAELTERNQDVQSEKRSLSTSSDVHECIASFKQAEAAERIGGERSH